MRRRLTAATDLTTRQAELVFQDVRVPKENVVGEVGGAALCMMRNLEIGTGTSPVSLFLSHATPHLLA